MKINADEKKIERTLSRGVEEIIAKESLVKKLKSGKCLRIKFGIDPTSPKIHLGNAVILWKLRDFQKLGHKAVLIIGDFTARIGDPSGRLEARKQLSEKEIKKNMATYKKQLGKILDLSQTELVYNSRHLGNLKLPEIYRIFQFFSANQILARDMFQERQKKEKPIWLHEFFYPVFQAYDSAVVKADVEIGGSDQLFNMMMGRQLQPHFKQPPQDVITMKLLVGTDGKRKMSKSFKNDIGIQESPKEQYGKIMSLPDELLEPYFELLTDLSALSIKNLKPRDAKAMLAFEIVKMYHGEEAALKTEKEFNKVFKEKKLPSKIPQVKVSAKKLYIIDLLVKTKLAQSKAAAKRLILQRGVKIDGVLQTDWRKAIEIKKGRVLQVGKRRFVKFR